MRTGTQMKLSVGKDIISADPKEMNYRVAS